MRLLLSRLDIWKRDTAQQGSSDAGMAGVDVCATRGCRVAHGSVLDEEVSSGARGLDLHHPRLAGDRRSAVDASRAWVTEYNAPTSKNDTSGSAGLVGGAYTAPGTC